VSVDLGGLFDTYTLRARLYPAFLTAAPMVVTVVVLWPTSKVASVWPVVVGMGTLFFLATWVRGRGQDLERHLTAEWAGLPTTHMLRHNGAEANLSRARRRDHLQRVTGVVLPSAAEEASDSDRADDAYVTATRALIVRVRQQQDAFPLVREENIHYGFRRNLLAMKPIAVAILGTTVAFDGCWLAFARFSPIGLIPLVASLGLTLPWATVVNGQWVWKQGCTYAERLFESLEDGQLVTCQADRHDNSERSAASVAE
jgi:hypothetical protein